MRNTKTNAASVAERNVLKPRGDNSMLDNRATKVVTQRIQHKYGRTNRTKNLAKNCLNMLGNRATKMVTTPGSDF